jgi:hypothetical protein
VLGADSAQEKTSLSTNFHDLDITGKWVRIFCPVHAAVPHPVDWLKRNVSVISRRNRTDAVGKGMKSR